MSVRQWLLLTVVLAGSPVVARGQEPQPGSRVRLRLADARAPWMQGELLRLGEDSLSLVPGGGTDTLTVATAFVARMDVSRGRHSQAGRGFLIGAGIGGVTGLVLSVAAMTEECQGFGCYQVGAGDVIAVTAFLAAAGGGLGALIGATSRRERWTEVPGPWRKVQVGASPAGFGLAIDVPF